MTPGRPHDSVSKLKGHDPRDPTHPLENPPTTLHEALQDAVVETRETTQPTKNFSVRLSEQAAAQAQAICTAHGTTLSGYLRHCVLGLIRDYGCESEAEE